MGEPLSTRPSLLVRIRDAGDREAWSQFVELYAPMVYGFARKRGLQDADAADLTQDVLRAIASAVGRLDYDPARGTFRNWLFTVARGKLHTFLARQRRQAQGSGDTSAQAILDEHPAPEEDEAALWDQEYERRLFAWAAERVRPGFEGSTWHAFWRTAVEGVAAKDVAEALGMTVGAVYIAKSRVLTRLKKQIQQLPYE